MVVKCFHLLIYNILGNLNNLFKTHVVQIRNRCNKRGAKQFVMDLHLSWNENVTTYLIFDNEFVVSSWSPQLLRRNIVFATRVLVYINLVTKLLELTKNDNYYMIFFIFITTISSLIVIFFVVNTKTHIYLSHTWFRLQEARHLLMVAWVPNLILAGLCACVCLYITC